MDAAPAVRPRVSNNFRLFIFPFPEKFWITLKTIAYSPCYNPDPDKDVFTSRLDRSPACVLRRRTLRFRAAEALPANFSAIR